MIDLAYRHEEVQVVRSTSSRSPVLRRLLPPAAVVLLIAAMLADTTYLSPEEAAAVNPPPFEASVYVDEKFPEIAALIQEQATDITELAPAVAADPAAAAETSGTVVGGGRYGFPVSATGTVASVDEDFIVLDVPGLPAGTVVRVPLGRALSGTPVRDVTGTIGFGDFPGQSAYQSVANEFALRMQSEVLAPVDPPTLQGQEITVVGAYVTGGPTESYLIQPVSIETDP